MTLGENIAGLRKKMGLSQEQLAEKIGVSRQAVSKWEQDGAQPELDKLIALCRLFPVSADVLLGLKAQEESGAAAESESTRAILRFLRRLWYNIGYFMLIWGALVCAAAGGATLLWRGAEPPFVDAFFVVGCLALLGGLALVLFRIRPTGGGQN